MKLMNQSLKMDENYKTEILQNRGAEATTRMDITINSTNCSQLETNQDYVKVGIICTVEHLKLFKNHSWYLDHSGT